MTTTLRGQVRPHSSSNSCQQVFFSQAPADIQYIVRLLSLEKHDHTSSCYIVNVPNSYLFFQHLCYPGLRFRYVDHPALFSLGDVVKLRRRLGWLYKTHFSNTSGAEVFFFSDVFDFVTPFFVTRLAKRNRVHFVETYQYRVSLQRPTLHSTLKCLTLCWLTGAPLEMVSVSGVQTFRLQFERLGIRKMAPPPCDLPSCCLFIPPELRKGNCVLVFDSGVPAKWSPWRELYQELWRNIIRALRERGIRVFVKPHPRLGCDEVFRELACNQIADFIPGEFIDTGKFEVILGLDSAALGFCAKSHGKVFSVIHIFEAQLCRLEYNVQEYLDNLSGHRVQFANSIEELLTAIELRHP